jgi:hypothetical protein
MFARRAASNIAPCESHILILKTEHNVVPVRQGASREPVPTEEAIFSFDSIEMNNVSYFHLFLLLTAIPKTVGLVNQRQLGVISLRS